MQSDTITLIIQPSAACPAHCKYCFGPNVGETMEASVFDGLLNWMASQYPNRRINLIFHGGEPLSAGKAWYRNALPKLRILITQDVRLSMQSNLWLLDEEFCMLLRKYGVHVGTSIDGPEQLNDLQRGKGYFKKTMAGIKLLRNYGIFSGVICTFTKKTAVRYKEVLDFFHENGLEVQIRGVIPALNSESSEYTISVDEYRGLLENTYRYSKSTGIRISLFDNMQKNILTRRSNSCRFTSCIGRFLTIDPRGDIYPCNRFTSSAEWKLGSIFKDSMESLQRSESWLKLQKYEEEMREGCGDCKHSTYCSGGCTYEYLSFGRDTGNQKAECVMFDIISEEGYEI